MPEPPSTYRVIVHRLDPTLAEVHIEFAEWPADFEVQGRITGPKCPGMSTVEIAYPLLHMFDSRYRVLIPDPACWSAERPYVYEGVAEFRCRGQKVGSIKISFGIKMRAPNLDPRTE